MLNSNIVRLRKKKGLKQIEFAKALGVSQSAVSHWETGRSIPETPQLFQLAEFFGISIDELVGDDDFFPRPQSTPPLMLEGGDATGWPEDELDRQLREEWSSLPDEIKKSTIAYIKFQKYGTKE